MYYKILAPGAYGFIGFHFTEGPVRASDDVKASVLYNSYDSWGWLAHCTDKLGVYFERLSGDIRYPQSISTVIMGRDDGLHLAALIVTPYSHHPLDTYVYTNIKGTVEQRDPVLEAINDAGLMTRLAWILMHQLSPYRSCARAPLPVVD